GAFVTVDAEPVTLVRDVRREMTSPVRAVLPQIAHPELVRPARILLAAAGPAVANAHYGLPVPGRAPVVVDLLDDARLGRGERDDLVLSGVGLVRHRQGEDTQQDESEHRQKPQVLSEQRNPLVAG